MKTQLVPRSKQNFSRLWKQVIY